MAEFRRGALILDLYYAGELGTTLLARELAKEGIPMELLGLLTEIARVGPLTPSQLSELTGLPPATLYDRVERLAGDGLVGRERNPADGRSTLIRVTPAGRTRVHRAGPAVRRAVLALMGHLDRPLEDVERGVFELREALTATLVRS